MEEDKEIQVIDILKEPLALGEIFAKSGVFLDVKSAAQGAIKVLAGKELGLSPIEAINSLYFVNNHLAMFSKVMGALVKKSNKYDYQIEKLDNTECIVVFYQFDGDKKIELGKSIFTWQDAIKAGLVNKQAWKDYPRNMLFSRAIANGIRWFTPDAVCGYMAVEELEDLPKQETTITLINGEIKKNGEKEISK